MSDQKTKPKETVVEAEVTGPTKLDNNVSKLTVKTMGLQGIRAALLKTIGEKVMLGRIYGQAKETKEKKRQGDSGELIIDHPIVGVFEGVNYETGEVFTSSILYLPGGFHEQLEQVLKSALDTDNVIFALEIGAEKSTCKAGFEWIARMIQKPATKDPLEEMRAKIAVIPKSKEALELAAPGAPAVAAIAKASQPIPQAAT